MKKYTLLFVFSFLGYHATFAQFEDAFYGVLDHTEQSRNDILDSIEAKFSNIINSESTITLADVEAYLEALQYDPQHPIGGPCEILPIPKCYSCDDSSNPATLLRWQPSPIAGEYFGGYFDMRVDYVTDQLNPLPAVFFPISDMAYKLITYGRRCNDGSQSSYSIIIIDEEIFLSTYLEYLDAQPELLNESIEEITTTEASTRYSPNPFNDFCKIEFSLTTPTAVSLHLVEATTGRIIREEFVQQSMDAATYIHLIDGNDLSPGVYFSILQIGEDQQVEKIIKIE